jgi:hypothetical protein
MSQRVLLLRTVRRVLLPATLTLTGLLTVHPTVFAEEVAGLAKRLADLRGEVETLSDDLSARKNDTQEQLRSFARQRSELELEIQREETRLQKMRQAVEQKRSETAAQKTANADLVPAFDKHVVKVRAYVQESLPFRTKERLAELDKIEEQLKSGLLPPQRALNRLWGFVEDELRMTRESGLFSQPVAVNDKEHLAEVVRVGMVALYYRTPTGELGRSTRDDGQWRYRPIDGEDDRKHISTLFETFKKQIRVGYFELPNALPAPR